jgi:DNA-binding MarR family transcriptional regulator
MDEPTRRAALTELHALPGHLLWRAAARVGVAVGRILPPGTDIHAHATLLALADHEPQSQRSLAEAIGVSGTTLTSVAHALQRDGLVERVRNPVDRRSYSLTRTAAGRSAVRRWGPQVARLETHLTSALTADQVSRLHDILGDLVGEELDAQTPQALRGSTAFLVTRAHQTAHREFLLALRPLDVEPRHVGTLRALAAAGPVTQNELGSLLDVSPATIVAIVDHLERRGLVSRQPDPDDRRVHRLRLSDTAGPVVDRARELSQQGLDLRLRGLPGDAHADLLQLLSLFLAPALVG